MNALWHFAECTGMALIQVLSNISSKLKFEMGHYQVLHPLEDSITFIAQDPCRAGVTGDNHGQLLIESALHFFQFITY